MICTYDTSLDAPECSLSCHMGDINFAFDNYYEMRKFKTEFIFDPRYLAYYQR